MFGTQMDRKFSGHVPINILIYLLFTSPAIYHKRSKSMTFGGWVQEVDLQLQVAAQNVFLVSLV